MKINRINPKVLLAGILLCFLYPWQVFPQITIGQSDMPSVGDTIRISTGINIDLYDFSETGADFVWDYSDLISLTQRVDTFVSVTQTPILYWPFFLLSSNLAMPVLQESPIPDLPLSDVYNFYHNSNDNYKDVGFAANLFGLPLPFKYDSPDILYEFPMNYGNVDSSESGFEFGLDNIGYIKVERNRVNTVDGWGTLTTPYGTFDVLRLKSEVTEYDSIYVDSLSTGIPITREYTEYKWMGEGQKLPLLKVTATLLTYVIEYIDSPSPVTNVQEKLNTDFDVRVYPNPAYKLLNIDFGTDTDKEVLISFIDMSGRVLNTHRYSSLNGRTLEIDLSSFLKNKGVYIISFETSKQRIFKKVVVNQL